MTVNLRGLIDKLNDQTRGALEGAAGLCLSRTHYDVEVEHFLLKLLDAPTSDFAAILRHYEVNRSRLAADLARSLDKLKSGNARTPSLSPSLVKMFSEAWTIGSIDFRAGWVRTGYATMALVTNDELARLLVGVSRELEKISAEDLHHNFARIVATSSEDDGPTQAAGAPRAAGEPGAPAGDGRAPKLEQFTVNLTERARQGKLDPVLGRDFEIRQVVDILTRRRQNNPILVGEAGVGKTAVVEGFAARIVQGDVPPVLRNVTLRTLDLALLQAGAGVKGEFENRLKGLIDEVKNSPTPIILFIDEAHTMIGAGGQAGQNDAANLLKPALARGELRTIASTTWSEYKKYFEKDPALTRRFQVVKVEEPGEESCLVMIRGLVPSLEAHHGVRILEEGAHAAVRLSHRYLPDRQLPDKAVSVLDTACARLALGQNATPPPIEGARRRLDDLATQERVLEREAATGADHAQRLAAIAEQREQVQAELAEYEERWEKERALVVQLRELRPRIEAATAAARAAAAAAAAAAAMVEAATPAPVVPTAGEGPAAAPEGPPAAAPTAAGVPAPEATAPASAEPVAPAAGATPAPQTPLPVDLSALRAEFTLLNQQLELIQGDTPLVPVNVDATLIGQVISGWTGIPVGKMMRDDLTMALELEQHLGRRIIGQAHALEIISRRIRTSRARIEDPQKPIGVFLLVGPSGVGKTETALALADLLYGGEHNVITINMSEFQESHTISTLKGSPPGYVGYGEGGVLTEAVRRRPYSVVLLDEIEKAHPDVLELFFQVFDKGRMEDGEGRLIDFKNTIILLTTNAGTDTIMKLCADPETTPSHDALVKALKPGLDKQFKPAFLGRTVIIPYFPIRDADMKRIIRLKLGRIQRRLTETHQLELVVDDALVDAVAQRCTEVESGARNVDNILTNTLLPAISTQLLQALVEGRTPTAIRVAVAENGEFTYVVEGASPAPAVEEAALAPA